MMRTHHKTRKATLFNISDNSASLERMAEDWQESKKPLLIQKTSDSE